VLIGADLFRAGLVLTLLWPRGSWHAYLVAAGLAAGNTFFNPTVQAVIPVLTSKEQRLAANSVAWSTGRPVQFLASAVAGGLIALLGTGPAFALNAASLLISALLIRRLRIPPTPASPALAANEAWAATSPMRRGLGSPSPARTASSRAYCRCRHSHRWRPGRPARRCSCSPNAKGTCHRQASPG
jgi:hypothetical protein